MKFCTKCLLPESFPNIKFDDNGVCNYCLTYKSIECLGEDALKDILRNHRRLGAEYDCIVPISGGRDSSFVLYQIVTKYNLNALVFNYDNGFATDQAKQNIANTVKKLGVPLVKKQSKRDIQKKLMIENLKLNIKKSSLHVLRDICNGCANGYKGGAFHLARERGVPIIIFGNSKVEEMVYKKEIFNKIIPELKDKLFNSCCHPINFIKRRYYNCLLEREFPYTGEKDKDIQIVHFFDYIEWDEKELVNTIEKELDWVGHGEATWRVDCKIHVFVDFLTFQIFGYNEKDEMYSKLIRSGKITREEALKRLKLVRKADGEHRKKIKELLGELNLNTAEIRKSIGL